MSSLYLHIPFCQRKCHYCDFFSVGAFLPAELDEYVELLSLEIRQLAQKHPATPPLKTVFFGGGTPSLLTAVQVEQLLRLLKKNFGFTTDCEISLEANPGTLDQAKLIGYRQAGINRLSLGVQTFNDSQLQILGRIHSAADSRQAVSIARDVGFDNLSLDLIFALPGQSLSDLQWEIEQLLALSPEHVGIYGLSIETGTPMAQSVASGQLTEPDQELYAESYLLLDQLLTTAGYEHYEISNFARPGRRCRHNQVYWQRGSCLAVGCGAHSFDATGWGERRAVPPDLENYRRCLSLQRDPSAQLETFDRRGAMAETLYLTLRTSDGVDARAFAKIFGERPEAAFPEAFSQLAAHLRRCDDRWFFNPESWLIYDHLISHFL